MSPTPAEHPVRIVVTDDLLRSRLTVFFRLFLAIPHFLWAGLFGSVISILVLIDWFAIVFTGRAPRDIQRFVAGFVRYVTQVEAYLFLAANRFPGFFLGSSSPYPVDLEIDPPERQSRAKALFRLVLALPAILVGSAIAGGVGGSNARFSAGGLLATSAFLVWFYALVRARAPRGLRDVTIWSLGYSAQTVAYLLLVTDRYPYTGPRGHLGRIASAQEEPVAAPPARVVVTDDLRRSRLLVFFRLPLALPHVLWLLLWGALALIVGVMNWFATLALGRAPRPFARFLAAYLRYQTHVSAFLYLIGGPFPGFLGKAGTYPLDLAIDPFASQRRLVTLFRLFLAVPAILVNGAAGFLLLVVAVLGWFVALVRGEIPEGLHDAGAWAIGYAGQVNAYLSLLSDRYPYSGPVLPASAAAS